MTPMVFAKGLADAGYWGDKFFGRVVSEDMEVGAGFLRKACRARAIYGLEPIFESGHTCVIKVHNFIVFGTKNENSLIEKNYDITIQVSTGGWHLWGDPTFSPSVGTTVPSAMPAFFQFLNALDGSSHIPVGFSPSLGAMQSCSEPSCHLSFDCWDRGTTGSGPRDAFPGGGSQGFVAGWSAQGGTGP